MIHFPPNFNTFLLLYIALIVTIVAIIVIWIAVKGTPMLQSALTRLNQSVSDNKSACEAAAPAINATSDDTATVDTLNSASNQLDANTNLLNAKLGLPTVGG